MESKLLETERNKCRTPNGRFCEMAAVTPQTILWGFQRLYPAASSVKPPPRKAAWTLSAGGGQSSRTKKCEKLKRIIKFAK